MVIGFLLLTVLVLLLIPPLRAWLLEESKELSDRLLLLFLQVTSRFGSELTKDGGAEQALWREQRLRNLRGLASRARQRFEKTQSQ